MHLDMRMGEQVDRLQDSKKLKVLILKTVLQVLLINGLKMLELE